MLDPPRWGGWSNKGIKAFDKYCKAIKNERAKAGYLEAEQEVLPRVRVLDRIKVNTEREYLQKKRRVADTAQPLAQEVAFEEEV